MTTAQLKDQIEQLEAQVRFWQACYRKAVSHDGRIIDTLLISLDTEAKKV